MNSLLYAIKQIAKFGLIALFTLLIADLSSKWILLFSLEEVMGQRGPRPAPPVGGPSYRPPLSASAPAFNIADELQNLPATTREELLAITNQSTLFSHLKKLQDLIEFRSEYNETNFDSASTGFSKLITYPSEAIAIYSYLSPVFVSPNNNQTYALLMLKFTNATNTSYDELMTSQAIHYNVKMNGTDEFNFDENGTTDTGVDIKIIQGIPPTDTINTPTKYSAVIGVLNINNNSVYEQTRPLSLNLTR